MDAATVRAMLEDQFKHAGSDPDRSHAMYREDAVLEVRSGAKVMSGSWS